MRLTRRMWIVLIVLVFTASFAVRILATRLFPKNDNHTDIEIYRASGALIVRGINPYDFSDQVPVRFLLREQSHNPAIRDLSQARWDYYASGNLPMNLFFFGGLSAISDTPGFYRHAFALFDSALSALILWFVIRRWLPASAPSSTLLTSFGMSLATAVLAERLAIALVLGCFSPVLFKYGGAIPEDKGIQILLMLAAVACYLSPSDRTWYWGGGVFLGLSIAFKGLGIFLVPLFVSRLVARRDRVWARSLVFAAVLGAAAGVWLLPFGPSIATMVKTRLMLGSTLQPQHASMWVLPSNYFPWAWHGLRLSLISAMVCVSAIGYWRKRIGIEIVCMTLLLGFVAVWLTNGSQDRQNIALLLVLKLVNI